MANLYTNNALLDHNKVLSQTNNKKINLKPYGIRRSLKKTVIIIAAMLLFSILTGCNHLQNILTNIKLSDEGKETVTIDKRTYKTNFYGNLYPDNLDLDDTEHESDGVVYRKVNTVKYDWMHASVGSKTSGTIYCLESQWDDAQEFYNNNDNFTFYCSIGVTNVKTNSEPVIYTIDNMDYDKYESLAEFCHEKEYNPFGEKSKDGEIILDMPNPVESPKILFYKVSNDGFFTSSKGHELYIIDGKLYFLNYFDHKDESMHAYKVPDELFKYFNSVVEQL